MSIQRKFVLSVSVLIVCLMLIAVGLTYVRTNTAIKQQVTQSAQQLNSSVVKLLSVTDNLMQDRVASTMKLLLQRIEQEGPVALSQPVQVKEVMVPDLLINDVPQANNFKLVDELTDIAGGTATLFSRDGDNFVRVATNVLVNGQRAIGTQLNPSGTVIELIKQGKAFFGQVDILGTPYLTGYTPLFNSAQQVVGIAYVGYKADLTELEASIKDSKLLSKGFVAVVDDKNRVRMHSDNQTTAAIESILAGSDSDWTVINNDYPAWQYRVIVAINHDDVAALVRAESFKIGFAVIFIGLLIIVLIAVLVNRLIAAPLTQTISRLTQITQGGGDLTQRLSITTKDEIGTMAQEFNQLLEHVRQTIAKFAHTSEALQHSANDLSSLADRATAASASQRQQTDHAAASIHEMAVTAQTVAQSTVDAEHVAGSVFELTDKANLQTQQLLKSIEQQQEKASASSKVVKELNSASEDIATVLNVIKSIAEQTNLLALNAAIEAARAGEQGRGFAVVASEVRNLAGKTQSSTDEIQTMIVRLQGNVNDVSSFSAAQQQMSENNTQSAQQAVNALQQVLDASKRINAINADIASAAEQQSVVAEDVSRNVETIKQGAEQNSTYAQETQNAANALQQAANEAKQLLARYQV
ncbi:methyl-accepting chemotaxis protein [Rheinheimera sp. UJ63]|uniref:methyl-accepting chemotaxis protein n=1 Tax=Rheinheimera sp. UJ63 TaxID=2910157 RepID=UPI001F480A0B|nr:Cache 3/Cache 2 fusion domain-containing protein [Rheinheimera sp. UJ63]MCF4010059.1 methyl-accepting chemotaxis protein [Rheinheimera sp. UJ63]